MPVFEFDSGDDSLGGEVRAWKGKEGESYHISMVWWPGSEDGTPDLDAKSPRFSGGMRHFHKDCGYFMNHGPEYTKLAGKKPTQAIVTIIVLWPLAARGMVDKERLRNKEYQVRPWVFSRQKYGILKIRHSEFPLGEHDLKVKCEDTQFQTLDISPAKNNLLRQLQSSEDVVLQEIYKDIIKKVQELVPDIDSHMGQDLSLDEVREKLGLSVSKPVESHTSDVEIDELIDDI